MSRLPTISDPNFAPSRIGFELAPIPPPSPSANAGPGIAAIGSALNEFGARVIESNRRQRVIEYETETIEALGKAMEAGMIAEPGQEQTAFDAALGPMTAKIDEEPDSEVRRRARMVYDEARARSNVSLGREVLRMKRSRFAQSVEANGDTMLRGVAAGTTTKDEALIRYKAHAKQGVGLVWSEADAEALSEEYGKSLDRAYEVAARGQLLEAQRVLSEDWARAETEEERSKIAEFFEFGVQAALEEGSIDAVQAETLRRAFEATGHMKADEEVGSLTMRANDAASRGDIEKVDELHERLMELPDSQDHRKALEQFKRLDDYAKTVRGGAHSYLRSIQKGEWPENPPQDEDSVNAYQNILLRGGTHPGAVAANAFEHGGFLGRDLAQTINGLFDPKKPGLFNLVKATEVLTQVREVSREQAMGLATGSDSPVIGRALWNTVDGTSGFSVEEAQRLLGNRNASMLLAEAGANLEPGQAKESAKVYTAVVSALGTDPSPEDYAVVMSDARLAYLSLSIDEKSTEKPGDRAKSAIKVAAERYRGRHQAIYTNYAWMRPTYAMVPKTKLPKDVKAFQGALNRHLYDNVVDALASSWFNGRTGRKFKPELIEKRESRYYVPAIDVNRIESILEYDESTGESTLLEPGDDLYKPLVEFFEGRVPREQIDWQADTRWHEGRVSRYMLEDDQLTGTDKVIRLRDDVNAMLISSGLYKGLSTQEQRKLLGEQVTLEVLARGWLGIEAPATPTPAEAAP